MHDGRVGGIPIPMIERDDQGPPRCLGILGLEARPHWLTPTSGCPFLGLGVFEIIRGPHDGQPFLGRRQMLGSRVHGPQHHH